MKTMTPKVHVIFVVALLLSGCGYEHNGGYDNPPKNGYQWHSLYREDIQTVAVPIFQNRDFRRGVEFSLTKAVVNQLEVHAPYKVVSKERADTVLEGEIVSVNISTISRLYNEAVPQEQLMIMTVNLRWRDLRTGQILLERKNFQQTSTFYPTLREGTWVASQDAVERLALGIVQEMQADW